MPNFSKSVNRFLVFAGDVRGRFLVISKKFFEFFIESVFFYLSLRQNYPVALWATG